MTTGGKGAEFREDSLVARLISDPSSLPDPRVELGFLGASTRKGYWRLYSGPDLNDYLEVSESDILHSQSLESADNPLGGTMLWLSREAVVHRTRREAPEGEHDFLQGAIANEFLQSTGISGLTALGSRDTVLTVIVVILSRVFGCPSLGKACA
jgi:hypothetical protein